MANKDNKEALKQELEELGSSLGRLNKQSGYELPADYFEKLPSTIQDKIISKQSRPAYNIAAIFFRRVVPLTAVVLLLVGLVFSLFLLQQNGVNGYFASDDQLPEAEYFVQHPGIDQELFFQMILESDIAVDELFLDEDFVIFDDDEYDDMLEDIFEQASYYGMESRYLLSYFD